MNKINSVGESLYHSLKKPLLIMRIAIFLLLVGFLQTKAINSYSQNTKLSISLSNTELVKVLDKIENLSEFYFLYNEKLIDATRKVSIEAKEERIADVLKNLFSGTDIEYSIIDRKIILAPSYLSESQQSGKKIIGKVTDQAGVSLPGVSVVVKGTALGVITDNNGNYSLTNIRENATLQFSFVGMKSQEISVGSKTSINVTLTEDVIGLDEVVTVGYGTQKKVNLTGVVSTVNIKQLRGRVATSATSLLQGLMPGVFVTEGSGQPGKANMRVLIRGLGTMNNANPMVLIDGIESSMNDINPNDIESINVLKDAASAAIYGTRAANGVVLVTTKRGELGRINVSYNYSYGMQNAVNLTKVLNSGDYAMLMNEAYVNNGNTAPYSADDIAKFKSGSDPYNYPNSRWLDELLQGSGIMQTHSLSISGGTEAARAFLSIESFGQEGLVKNTNYSRSNIRFNLDSKVNNWLHLGLNSSLLGNVTSEPTEPAFKSGIGQIFRQCEMIPPTAPIKNAAGDYVPWSNGNPIAWMEQGGKYDTNNIHIVGSMFAEITFMEGLVLKGVMGVNNNFDDNKSHIKSITYTGGLSQGPNEVNDVLMRNLTVTLQSYLTYVKSIKNHNLTAMVGVARESNSYKYDQLYRNTLPSNELDQIDAGAISSWKNSGNSSDAKLGSYFGRFGYNYNNKYLFEANVRRDGSSKFGPGYRWGTFPSFSAGWRLNEERFLQDISWLNNFKLRGSWGMLGNHNIGNYLSMPLLSLGQNYPFGGAMKDGAASTTAAVPDITWETTTEWDIGFDTQLLHNKFSASFDYYDRYTDNILTTVPVSIVFGLPAPTVNSGAMRNKGIELQVGHNNSIGDLTYNLTANIAFNDNKVEKFPKPSLGSRIRKEGESWDAYYGYECIGIYQTDVEATNSVHVAGAPVKAGDLIFKDQNGDNVVDGNDRIVLGTNIPKITYGFDMNLTYKNIDFSMLFQGAGNVSNDVGNTIWPFVDGGTAYERHLDRAIVENGKVVKEGYYPRSLMNAFSNHNSVYSSFQVMNSAYLRLKNLQLGYTLPPSLTNKVKLSRVRVYFSGKNLLLLTKFLKDYDPELNGGGNSTYPQVQFYTLGLNVNF